MTLTESRVFTMKRLKWYPLDGERTKCRSDFRLTKLRALVNTSSSSQFWNGDWILLSLLSMIRMERSPSAEPICESFDQAAESSVGCGRDCPCSPIEKLFFLSERLAPVDVSTSLRQVCHEHGQQMSEQLARLERQELTVETL